MSSNGFFKYFFIFLFLATFNFCSYGMVYHRRNARNISLKNSHRSNMDTQVSSDSNYTGPEIDVDGIMRRGVMRRVDRMFAKNNKKKNITKCEQNPCSVSESVKSPFERMLDFICCILERSDNLCQLAANESGYYKELVDNNFFSNNNEKFATLYLGHKKIILLLKDDDLISGKNRKSWNESVKNAFREVEYDENKKSVRFSEVYCF